MLISCVYYFANLNGFLDIPGDWIDILTLYEDLIGDPATKAAHLVSRVTHNVSDPANSKYNLEIC